MIVPSETEPSSNHPRRNRNDERTQTQTTSRNPEITLEGQIADERTDAEGELMKSSTLVDHNDGIRRMKKRINDLENEVQKEKEAKRRYRHEYHDFKHNLLPAKDNELRRCQDKNLRLQYALNADRARINELQHHLKQREHKETQYKDTISNLRSQNEQMTSLVEQHNREIQDLRYQLKQRDLQEAQYKAAIAALESQNIQRALLIEQHHEEQQVTKEFLDSHDKLSGADIVAKVRAINEQIFQIAATIAESCNYRKTEVTVSTSNDAYETQPVFKRLLSTTDHVENPEIVQIALQERLVFLTTWITAGWGLHSKSISQFLDALTRRVQEERASAISRRWRSITHSHVVSMNGTANDLVELVTGDYMKALAVVLRTAGGIVEDSIEASYKPRISGLVHQTLELQKIIKQDIMSCDYVPFHAEVGVKFNPEVMLDYELNELDLRKGGTVSGRVLCTTALGMLRIASDKGDKGAEGRTVLLKPMVARDAYLISIKDAIEAGNPEDYSDI